MRGIEEVARHKQGSIERHRQAWTAQQEDRLKEAASEGRFRTVGEAVRWCAEVLRIEVSEGKVYYWFGRWGYRKKVPRPLAQKVDVEAQEVWKKSSLEALCKKGLRRGEEGVFVDEMRVGLLGQSRRVWGKRGETVRQRVEVWYDWAYLI